MESFNFLTFPFRSYSILEARVYFSGGCQKIIVLFYLVVHFSFLHGDGNQVALAGNGIGIIIDPVVSVLSEVDPIYGVGSHTCGGEGQGECCGSQ